MATASKAKLFELQATISKMSLEACCVTVLPELGLRWVDVSRTLRSNRLPMTSASAARVLSKHIAITIPSEEYDDLLNRMRLKLVATKPRVWHLVSLSEPLSEQSAAAATEALPSRVRQALRNAKIPKNMTPVVESVSIGDLVYISVQLVSATRQGGVVFCAVPPGQDVALFSSLGAKSVVRAVVEGLGYRCFEDERLQGRDVASLLRLHARAGAGGTGAGGAPALPTALVPPYRPLPVLTDNGIDFTNTSYNESYVEQLLGPDPPLITDLKIQTSKSFFNSSRLRKSMNLTVEFRCSDVAARLRQLARLGALPPASPLVTIFTQMQCNSVLYQPDED